MRIATTTPPTFGVMTLHYSLQIIIEEVVIAEHAVVEYERLLSSGEHKVCHVQEEAKVKR